MRKLKKNVTGFFATVYSKYTGEDRPNGFMEDIRRHNHSNIPSNTAVISYILPIRVKSLFNQSINLKLSTVGWLHTGRWHNWKHIVPRQSFVRGLWQPYEYD